MSSVVVIGAQWGDEGKGKVVDYLAQKADAVVRYSGGSNAGHTVVVNDVAYKLRLLPSGILYHGKVCILGNGVVINPGVVLQEIKEMHEKGVDISRIAISDRAHVVLPYHQLLDALQEEALGSARIGTTKGGIGPCYMDKVARVGIRMCDLVDKDVFAEKLKINMAAKNAILTKIYGAEPLDYETVLAEYLAYAEQLRPYVTDTGVILDELMEQDKKVLFEGAQATFLDIDHGTYPYVTSSNPTAGNASTGSGIGPLFIDHVVGVVKAYTTRVGEGPFVTELLDTDGPGHQIRETGHEYGTVTGRPRRCGWLDMVALKYAIMIDGVTQLIMMKSDVMNDFDTIRVATAYEIGGERTDRFPYAVDAPIAPVYKEFKGWKCDLRKFRRYEDFPAEFKAYVEFIERETGVPVRIISVGPDRDETIVR